MKKRGNCNIKRFINNIKKKLISGSNNNIENIKHSRAHTQMFHYPLKSLTRRPPDT